MKRRYSRPDVARLGTLRELTLDGCKNFGGSDGFYLLTPSDPIVDCS